MTSPILIVTGTRHAADSLSRSVIYHHLSRTLVAVQFGLLVVGDAAGTDAVARDWAKDARVPVRVFRADWEQHGKAAGPIRNRAMVQHAVDSGRGTIGMAFPDKMSRGTWDCLRHMTNAMIPVQVVPLSPE